MARLDPKASKFAQSILEFKREDFLGARTSKDLKGPRLIIPSSIRLEIPDRIHDGHQEIVKCRRRTKDSVWWPRSGTQLEEMLTNCCKCIDHRKPNSEPMILSAVPERPWQVLGTDFFSLNGRTYLLVMDYYSRFFEISIPLAYADVCRRRTKDSVWWPRSGTQLEEMLTNCCKCIEHRKPNSEPMILSAVPERPWQVLGTDFFSLNGRTYFLVMDYYSRFFEISIPLASQKTSETIRTLKSKFARQGIPDILRSGNGPKFVSTEFDEFSKEYSFTHMTPSHLYAAGQWRSRTSRIDHKECAKERKRPR